MDFSWDFLWPAIGLPPSLGKSPGTDLFSAENRQFAPENLYGFLFRSVSSSISHKITHGRTDKQTDGRTLSTTLDSPRLCKTL